MKIFSKTFRNFAENMVGKWHSSPVSILVPLPFLICINDLPKGLSSNAKLFADDTLFSVIHDSSSTKNELNDDLVKINNWAYRWKTRFQ